MISMLLGLLLAPLLAGVINRVKAFFAGRRGRPLLQLYWDLARLVRKHMVLSRTTTPVFLLGPALSLASLVTCLTLVPLGGPSLLFFPGDLLVLLGLLALVRFATVLAAMDTGSSFEGMGASREVAIGALAEPGMFLALAVLVVQTRSVSLSEMWAQRSLDLWSDSGMVLVLVGVALFLLLLSESCRIPVDDPNTHLELTMIHEVMVLDHSGPALAAIEYASSLKMWIVAALISSLLFPFHTGSALLDLGGGLVVVFLVALGVGLVESTSARLSMLRVPQFVGLSSALSLLALFLVIR